MTLAVINLVRQGDLFGYQEKYSDCTNAKEIKSRTLVVNVEIVILTTNGKFALKFIATHDW